MYHAEVDSAVHDRGCGVMLQHDEDVCSEAMRCLHGSVASRMTVSDILVALRCGGGDCDAVRSVIADLVSAG